MVQAGPKNEDIAKCSGCHADIVWLKTKKGKNMPVNATPTKQEFRPPRPGELQFMYGEHEPHWSTCPDVDNFR